MAAVMGRQHALCGLIGGIGFATAIPTAPAPLRALLVVVTGGAALLPDLDHPSAVAARSLGLFTKLIAIGIDRLAVAVFYATRSPGDPAEKNGGHRLLTHTVVWNLGLGGLLGLLGWVFPVSLVVVCGLLVGLLGLGLRVAGTGLAVTAAAVSWWSLDQYPEWTWTVAVAVALGGLVHLAGDWVTPSGLPLLWPLKRQGQRWMKLASPVNFIAGSAVETALVAPALFGLLIVSAAWSTGVLGIVLTAVAA